MCCFFAKHLEATTNNDWLRFRIVSKRSNVCTPGLLFQFADTSAFVQRILHVKSPWCRWNIAHYTLNNNRPRQPLSPFCISIVFCIFVKTKVVGFEIQKNHFSVELTDSFLNVSDSLFVVFFKCFVFVGFSVTRFFYLLVNR